VIELAPALALAVVQGLTEFLPVSSDGHLALAHALLDFETSDDLLFDLVLHLGTLVAVLAVFGRDVVDLLASVAKGMRRAAADGPAAALAADESLRLGVIVGVTLFPTAVIGLLVKEWLDAVDVPLVVVGAMLVANGLVLAAARLAPLWDPREPALVEWHGIGLRDAVLLGIAQGLATLPGISRSGCTIVTGLLLGADQRQVARLSFVMSIPAILGAFVIQAAGTTGSLRDAAGVYVLSALVAAAVGVGALRLLLRVLERAQFHHFAWYCFAVGGLAIALGLRA
jgi:undecaprenyl-diphosphatase